MGRSVSSPESDSSSSQESATGCFFLNADADLETCGFMESLLREDSSSGTVSCASLARDIKV